MKLNQIIKEHNWHELGGQQHGPKKLITRRVGGM
jgi:hypothetical protein